MKQNWTVRAITRATLPLLLVLTVVEIVGSGLVLGSVEETLIDAPSLLVLVPVTIGTAGNLGSVLAARLSTAVHLGTVEFDARDDALAGNGIATVALALTVFPAVGAGAWVTAAVTTGATTLSPWRVVLVATIAGMVLAVLAVAITVVTTYVAYRRGLDPDDVVIPVVTNTCDVLGVVVLFAAVRLFVP
jgi:mgtE-like transporter